MDPSIRVKDFDLARTVRSGQLFAYEELGDGRFLIVDGATAFTVRQVETSLSFAGTSPEHLVSFFDLAFVHAKFCERLRRDPVVEHIERSPPLRLVRQDVRQAILTFILTSNNNQKRIKGMVDRLRAAHGRVIPHPDGSSARAFPLRGAVTEEQLVRLGFGYRAAFYCATDGLVDDAFLRTLKSVPYREAKALLMTLPGVGPKVADCILAYSALARGEAFPADVWVKRAVKRWYAFRKPLTHKNIEAFAIKRFGTDAAYAQHYLFLAAQKELS